MSYPVWKNKNMSAPQHTLTIDVHPDFVLRAREYGIKPEVLARALCHDFTNNPPPSLTLKLRGPRREALCTYLRDAPLPLSPP